MFDDMITDIVANNKLIPIVTEMILVGRKLNISLDFVSKSNLKVSKTVTSNATHYFIMTIPNKREQQQTASNDLSGNKFTI